MRILFTGASSFTGYWFAKELAEQGHQVFATFRSSLGDYDGIRGERVHRLIPLCEPIFGCPFGSSQFLHCLETQRFDVLCHHAAQVENYKSDDFDAIDALVHNTCHIREVISLLKGRRLIITGSITEKGEGKCEEQNHAFSPYGLSKFLTSELIEFECHRQGLPLGKFVIPNPFGPYEEERFTSWLIKNWFRGDKPQVKTPYYTRDNIHVTLLAKAYAHFVTQDPPALFFRLNPSGYISTQEAFTEKFAEKMTAYLQIPCEFSVYPQTEFSEPKVRVNTNPVDAEQFDWDEERAWRKLAEYYRNYYPVGIL
ncbi:MAG: hypothetical protein K940chlam3_00655 [Chlamydiae bacterium]|nr:hypothetical protein [Chlamydiota bacterium]